MALQQGADREAFNVGDKVSTDFSGRVTVHRITQRFVGMQSQTGVMYYTTPEVPRGSGGPIDHAWSTLLEKA